MHLIILTVGHFINDFRILSITSNSIIISWDVIQKDNSTLTLSITDSHQTINNTINVTGDNNMYNFTHQLSPCNVYTFKLTIPTAIAGCISNEDTTSAGIASFYYKIAIPLISALILKPENVSAEYFPLNETLRTKFQVSICTICRHSETYM